MTNTVKNDKILVVDQYSTMVPGGLPGSPKFYERLIRSHGQAVGAVYHQDGLPVAEQNVSEEEALATAHLFKASPALYKALTYARRFMKPDDIDVQYIDNVLAYARGETAELPMAV